MRGDKVTMKSHNAASSLRPRGRNPVVIVGSLLILAIAVGDWPVITNLHPIHPIWLLYLGVAIVGGSLLHSTVKRFNTMWTRLSILTDWLALERFDQTYERPDLSGVTVVIPAFNEAATLRQTLNAIPSDVSGLPIRSLVVSDGSNDDTPLVASQSGAYVCHIPLRRGQGAALRLGYHLARRYGSQFVVTMDADGQYVPSEIGRLLRPIMDGEADFVQGSRRLGAYELESRLRIAGVFLFGWMISLLTGHPITDSSNGFRAIRTDILGHLTLKEDQYHASELLMGSILKGYRVIERPVTMLRRQAGQTKKAWSLLYGIHYARVILGTWLRGG